MIPIIIIEGATATGKSALAMSLAGHFGNHIISADSRQVYRYLDIGTAKVSKKERETVSHHLIDIIDPNESYNAGLFAKNASAIASSLKNVGIIPIICGGTGLYIRSLLHGLFTVPDIDESVRNSLKERLSREGITALYAELKQIDPHFASKVSINDSQRIIRGLEVAIGTGVCISEHWNRQQKSETFRPFRILIDIPRQELYQRINSRMQQMINSGLLSEINRLFELGYTEQSPGLNSLGYKEFIPYIKGDSSLSDCINMAAQHHRNYAKRQVTWYRKCTFDLTLHTSQVKLSELILRIEDSFSRGK